MEVLRVQKQAQPIKPYSMNCQPLRKSCQPISPNHDVFVSSKPKAKKSLTFGSMIKNIGKKLGI